MLHLQGYQNCLQEMRKDSAGSICRVGPFTQQSLVYVHTCFVSVYACHFLNQLLARFGWRWVLPAALSTCSEQGRLFPVVRGLLAADASLAAER